MQESGGVGRGAEERGPALPPVWAFILLGAVATIVPLTLLATRPDAAPSTAPATSTPDYSLTDAEAIAEFERLRSLAISAVRERDVTLVDAAFHPEGPIRERALREIESLIKSDVIDRSRFVSIGVEIVRNSPDQIEIREESRLNACFRDASGVDVSRGPAEVVQVAVWTLRLERDRWLIHDSVIRQDRVTKKAASCA